MLNENIKLILGEELVKQVEAKLESIEDKDKVIIANVGDGSYMPRTKYNSLNDSVEDLKKQIADRNIQLTNLKNNNKGNEDLLQQIKDLEISNKQIKSEYEDKLTARDRSYAIQEAIASSKAKNVKTILPLLDDEKIIYKDGKLEGLSEQLEAIKKDNDFLFEVAKQGGGGFNPNPNNSGGTTTNDTMNALIRGA